MLNSVFALVAIVKGHVEAWREAELGTLTDFISVAVDVGADDQLLDEFERWRGMAPSDAPASAT